MVMDTEETQNMWELAAIAAASHDEIAAGVMMSQNSMLAFGGVTPCMAVLGTDPRELYEIDNTSVEARQVSCPEMDYLERSTRRRLLAKSAILRAVAETRIVQANASRPQMVDQELKEGMQIDVYRAPSSKDQPGWKGQAQPNR